MTTERAEESCQPRWDGLITELHRLRGLRGEPSYSTIAQTISDQRMEKGVNEHAARIARSTVHSAFRLGRSRINIPLTREIVTALDGDPTLVDEWLARANEPAPREKDAVATTVTEAESEPLDQTPPPIKAQLLLMVACVTVNLVGREFVDFFGFPIYLDMVGTAVAALALGPWRGAGVGLVTNVIGIIGSGWISLPFALANVLGALVWGYGARRYGMGRTLPRFFALNLLVALSCTLVAVPVIATFLGFEPRVGQDAITEVVRESIHGSLASLAFSNLLTSTADKVISGFMALVVLSSLPLAFRHRANLTMVDSAQPAASNGE